MNYHARFEKVGEFLPDALIAGNAHLLVGRRVSIATGEALPRGAVIGQGAVGHYTLATGAVEPDLILAEDFDGVSPREVLAYSRGDFNLHALSYGDGLTLDEIAEILRLKGIVLLPALT